MDFQKCKVMNVDTESLDRLLTQYQTLILDKMEQIINNQNKDFLSRVKSWRDVDGWAIPGMDRPGDYFDHNPDLELSSYTRQLDPLIRLSNKVWRLQKHLRMLDSYTYNDPESNSFNKFEKKFLEDFLDSTVELPS